MEALIFTPLEKALLSLEAGFIEAAAYPELLTTRDGVIQRFEIAMDLSWKFLQRVLKNTMHVDESVIRTKKDIFRQAHQYGLIDDPLAWFAHYETRNKTSHIYDEAEAFNAFEQARIFLNDARIMLSRLKMPLDVYSDDLKIIHDILTRYVPQYEIWAFGSRIKGQAHTTSDLDLCIKTNQPMSHVLLGGLKDAFSDSNIPYVVDVVDWSTLSEPFKKVIQDNYLIIQSP